MDWARIFSVAILLQSDFCVGKSTAQNMALAGNSNHLDHNQDQLLHSARSFFVTIANQMQYSEIDELCRNMPLYMSMVYGKGETKPIDEKIHVKQLSDAFFKEYSKPDFTHAKTFEEAEAVLITHLNKYLDDPTEHVSPQSAHFTVKYITLGILPIVRHTEHLHGMKPLARVELLAAFELRMRTDPQLVPDHHIYEAVSYIMHQYKTYDFSSIAKNREIMREIDRAVKSFNGIFPVHAAYLEEIQGVPEKQ